MDIFRGEVLRRCRSRQSDDDQTTWFGEKAISPPGEIAKFSDIPTRSQKNEVAFGFRFAGKQDKGAVEGPGATARKRRACAGRAARG